MRKDKFCPKCDRISKRTADPEGENGAKNVGKRFTNLNKKIICVLIIVQVVCYFVPFSLWFHITNSERWR